MDFGKVTQRMNGLSFVNLTDFLVIPHLRQVYCTNEMRRTAWSQVSVCALMIHFSSRIVETFQGVRFRCTLVLLL